MAWFYDVLSLRSICAAVLLQFFSFVHSIALLQSGLHTDKYRSNIGKFRWGGAFLISKQRCNVCSDVFFIVVLVPIALCTVSALPKIAGLISHYCGMRNTLTVHVTSILDVSCIVSQIIGTAYE